MDKPKITNRLKILGVAMKPENKNKMKELSSDLHNKRNIHGGLLVIQLLSACEQLSAPLYSLSSAISINFDHIDFWGGWGRGKTEN